MKPLDDGLNVAHEINVTPFIDVVLVLLIIFMVAAPLATVSVPVDLPSAATTEQTPPEDPIYLTLQEDNSLLVGETAITDEQLSARLEQETNGDKQQRIYVRADKALDYGSVMALLSRLQTLGYAQAALVGMDQEQ